MKPIASLLARRLHSIASKWSGTLSRRMRRLSFYSPLASAMPVLAFDRPQRPSFRVPSSPESAAYFADDLIVMTMHSWVTLGK